MLERKMCQFREDELRIMKEPVERAIGLKNHNITMMKRRVEAWERRGKTVPQEYRDDIEDRELKVGVLKRALQNIDKCIG